MFALLSNLASIVSAYGLRFLDRRRGSKDTQVAAFILQIVLTLQELTTRGERVLTIAEQLNDKTAEFDHLLTSQLQSLAELRTTLAQSQGLLATIDVDLYFDLVPFIDEKSGLLTRWSKQATRSRYSTTTLFFLPDADLKQVIDAGRAHAGPGGMDLERTSYLLAVNNGLRQARATEIRDIRTTTAPSLNAEIAAARAELTRTKNLCRQLIDATSQAVGPDAMASLRRRLVPPAT